MRDTEDRTLNATFELVTGTAAIVVAAFAAAAMFSLGQPAGRIMTMAVAAGVLAALFTDRWAVAGIAVVAALVFVGFLAHQDAVLTGDPTPWALTPVIGLAALLGRACRWIVQIRTKVDSPTFDEGVATKAAVAEPVRAVRSASWT